MSLQSLFTEIANSIRNKDGSTSAINAETFPSRIDAIQTGVDTSDASAVAGDILSGKTAYAKGSKVTGTIASKTVSDLSANGATITAPAGYYSSQVSKSVTTATQATPSITVDAAGKITASATQTAGYVTAGTKSATQQLSTQTAKTVAPTTSEQTAVASGVYTTGAVKVSAIPTQTKTTTAGTSNTTITPDSGKFLSSVTVKPTPSQEKRIYLSPDVMTITPDSGTLLSKVTVASPVAPRYKVKNMFNDENNMAKVQNQNGTLGTWYWSINTSNTKDSSIGFFANGANETELTRSPWIKPAINNTHTYYFRCWLYQPTKCGSFDFYWPIAEPSVISNVSVSANATFTRVSKVFTRTGFTNGEQQCRFDFNSPGTGSMYISGWVLVDLTESFGAGNEPTQDWCDNCIQYTTGDVEQTVVLSSFDSGG